MFKVALCACPKSKESIERKLSAFLGISSIKAIVYEYKTIDELMETETYFDLYFLNQSLLNNSETLMRYAENGNKDNRYSFMTYVNDPISDKDCDIVIDCLRRYIGYDSMYIAVEFLTDRGFRSIAISKILYFEFTNRKIKIKTQDDEYSCDDTLRNIMSLVSRYEFHQPHKSFIVNFSHIANIKNYIITMNDSSTIPLSQKKSKEFRQAYKRYIEQHPTKITEMPRKRSFTLT